MISADKYGTNFLQINQVAKHPAIFCHDVCVIGWLKSEPSLSVEPKIQSDAKNDKL